MRRVAEELAIIGVAIQFLTRVRVPSAAYSPERMIASVRWYPLVGILVGAIGAGVLWAAGYVLPATLAVLISTAATLLMTGAFHEDGLADLFDGLGATSRDRMLEVMRDSRVGTFGVLALGLVVATKVAALADLPLAVAAIALVAGHALSRASSVIAIASGRYAREEGTAKPVSQGIDRGSLTVAVSTAAVACLPLAFVTGPGAGLAAAVGAIAGHVVTRLLYERRLGGYTGDCLGAVQQLTEVGFYLGLVAWL